MRFLGGPYDERDLPIQSPYPRIMRLPQEQDLEAFLESAKGDPGTTGSYAWPYLYELDESVEPGVYRFKEE